MKVLYIASTTSLAGGSTKSLIAMLIQAQALGIDMEVICPDENGLTRWLRDRGIKVHVVAFRHASLPTSRTLPDIIKWIPRYLYYSWINKRGKEGVKRIAQQYAPDIIHENSSAINVGFYAAKAIGVPEIIHIREYGDLDFNLKLPDRKRRLNTENVFSIPITKDISRHLNQDTNPRATQIYDGIVRSSEFRINEEKENWFLFAGRIEEAKGIEELLKAYAIYVNSSPSPFPLYVCGGCGMTDYLDKLKAFVSENGLERYVIWMGERDDIAEFMAKSAATIIPSRFEGLGRVMPEAMANGSLCVARYTGGTKEQLDNATQFTGAPIAYAYENEAELVDILLKITDKVKQGDAFLPNTEFRQMINRSQVAVKEFFSEESFGIKILNLYKKILDKSKTTDQHK